MNDQDRFNQLMTRLDEHEKTTEQRFEAGNKRMNEMAEHMLANKKAIEEIRDATTEIVDIFRSATGFIKVMNWVGVVSKWVAVTAAGVGVLWAAITHGVKN